MTYTPMLLKWPLVPGTKMADIAKLISLGNLLVKKVTWLVLTATSANLILSRASEADRMIRIAYIYSCLPRTHSLHFDSQRQHTLSLLHCDFQRQHTLLLLHFSLTEIAHSLSFSPLWLPETAVNPTKMYTFCNLFLSCSAFSVRLLPASNTTTEISSNPERDKQPT